MTAREVQSKRRKQVRAARTHTRTRGHESQRRREYSAAARQHAPFRSTRTGRTPSQHSPPSFQPPPRPFRALGARARASRMGLTPPPPLVSRATYTRIATHTRIRHLRHSALSPARKSSPPHTRHQSSFHLSHYPRLLYTPRSWSCHPPDNPTRTRAYMHMRGTKGVR